MDIIFTIDNEKVSRVIDTMNWLFPIPQINTGTEEEPIWENEFTENQWAKEAIRRWIIKQVKRYETYQAKQTVDIPAENDLVS